MDRYTDTKQTRLSISYWVRKVLFLLLLVFFFNFPRPVFSAPPLMLANVYQPGMALSDYWVSEKMDGVRGYWDGEQLWTRGGHLVQVPGWFTADWPALPMDGELWAGRGRFDMASATVRALQPDDGAWRGMRFMVFDLPTAPGVFNDRLKAMHELLPAQRGARLQAVEQRRVRSHAELMQQLDAVVKAGGEGLMLHSGSSLYRAERSDDLLKLKPWEDAEAVVIAVLPGKGKYQGLMGALLVEMPSGLRFRIGSGFSDAERQHPPPPGTLLTYRYRGLHASGIPRFASFLRLRRPE
ncbi:MAG: DNA ligase [Moraxellaceae bacterium]